jgi:hypothetical protein
MISTKRITVISILAAFSVVVSLIMSILPQAISPSSAQAETTQTVFTNVGTTTWTVPSGVTSVQVLVLAGGGGGGGASGGRVYTCGGGGGAGGVVYNASYTVIPNTTITVTVGNGGNGGNGYALGSNGGNSVFGSITATGGGGGGSGGNSEGSTGLNGGSGGGGGGRTVSTTLYYGGTGVTEQGYWGGSGRSNDICCVYTEVASGGGGGAGVPGGNASDLTPGNGGTGVNYNSIFGNVGGLGNGNFAGGGGGANYNTKGSASYGGGAGARNGENGNDGYDGTVNTGGGGGGGVGGILIDGKGGNGGSGIVIVKYVVNEPPAIGNVSSNIVIYNTAGSYTFTPPAGVTEVEYLVIGGGGGGGGVGDGNWGGGGGGGAGGFRNGSYPVIPLQSYTVLVGAGGSAGGNSSRGGNGGNSSFAAIIANGGGGGASGPTPGDSGAAGGSGGGGRWNSAGLGGAGNTPATDPSQGNKGGNGDSYGAGGGGGSSAAGANGNGNNGGVGGAGKASSISGTSVTYAGGGGGGGYGAAGGAGGSGGGGSAPASRGVGNPGTNGSGGGGATGSSSGNAYNGGTGGSGIVIIKYRVTAVSLWTTEGTPIETDSLVPQLEFNMKIPVTDNNSLNDLSTIQATIYYDVDGIYNVSEVPTSGSAQTCAILTWTRSTNTLIIDAGTGSSWSAINSSSIFPTLSNTSGTFEFHFKPGKVAITTTGSARWQIYVKVIDSGTNTGIGTKTNLTMAWYGEVVINTAGVNWGTVNIGSDFLENKQSNISVTYTSNGDFKKQIKASNIWGAPPTQVTLNESGIPIESEFSLKAANTAFYDDFESGNLNKWDTAQSPWTVYSTGVYQGTYCGYASGNQAVLSKALPAMSAGWIEVKAKFGETNKYHYPIYNNDYLLVAMDNGHFGYFNGSFPYKNLPVDTTYSAGVWYDCKVYVDLSNDRYKVYIDGVDKGWITDNAQLNAASDISPYSILNAVSNNTGTMYIDLYKVRGNSDLNNAVSVLSSVYSTIDTGCFRTNEAGEIDTGNTIWLKLGPSGFPATTYNGTIYFQIAQ